jgi:hypothetical protein
LVTLDLFRVLEKCFRKNDPRSAFSGKIEAAGQAKLAGDTFYLFPKTEVLGRSGLFEGGLIPRSSGAVQFPADDGGVQTPSIKGEKSAGLFLLDRRYSAALRWSSS